MSSEGDFFYKHFKQETTMKKEKYESQLNLRRVMMKKT